MKKTRNKDRGGKGEIKWARQGMVRASERQKKTIKEEDIERPTIIEIGRDREMEEKQRREKTNKRRTQQKQGR